MSNSMIIAVANQKGGVGKTTTAVNLAACLDYLGHRTLAIDMDIQGNMTQHFGIDTETLKGSVADALMGVRSLEEIIWPGDGLSIAPANLLLEEAANKLIGMGISGHTALKERLEPIKDRYEYIIIDCPPSTGVLTENALVAATDVIVPIAIDFFSLLGIKRLLVKISDVKLLNPKLEITGYLLTRVDLNDRHMVNMVTGKVRESFGDSVFNTIIRKNTPIAKSPASGQPVIYFSPYSRGSKDYKALAREIIAWSGNGKR